MDISALLEIGLTEGEIKVYLALLQLGSSTTGSIIQKSGVARSFIYTILQRLIEKGLVSYVSKEKIKYYQASDPSKIFDYIQKKEKDFQQNKSRIQTLLPLLLQKKSEEAVDVRVFEGFQGLISAHEHTYQELKKGEEYFYLGITQEQPEYYHSYWNKDHKRRVRAGIFCRLLFHPSTSQEILRNRNKYTGCDARYMPLFINTPAWFMGYRDYTVISFPSSKPVTIQIKNKEIAFSIKSYFETFWKKSKKFSKEYGVNL